MQEKVAQLFLLGLARILAQMRTRGDQCLNMGDLGGHQVAAVFCCKSICRLVTLIERCFRTSFCIFACMRFYVLVYATKFPAMDICYSAQRMRFLWPLCLFDVSFVSNRCSCSVWCLLSARAKVLGWLVHILCMHSHAFWGVKRI